MKGMVFVELLNMAEKAFGEDVVDDVLDKTDLAADGAYTAVGNYPCSELIKIVEGFSDHSGLSPEVLQRKFGHWMLDHFGQNYPEFFKDKSTSFDMLEAVDGEIHVEVRKLYPDADLPKFATDRTSSTEMTMSYRSPRPLVGFCHGLIEACLDRFDQQADIQRSITNPDNNATDFQIRLR